ncbi:hypothetical protein KW798_00040 [Candidatus Parcubacteria bacterium]|nr:hypothetical protein [Candidatus Parcubacteria bacterium]
MEAGPQFNPKPQNKIEKKRGFGQTFRAMLFGATVATGGHIATNAAMDKIDSVKREAEIARQLDEAVARQEMSEKVKEVVSDRDLAYESLPESDNIEDRREESKEMAVPIDPALAELRAKGIQSNTTIDESLIKKVMDKKANKYPIPGDKSR